MNIMSLLLLGISLSVDAFSLSLCYGLTKISKLKIVLVSLLVGIFHFIMPIFGNLFGIFATKHISINSKTCLIIVLFIILIDMIRNVDKQEESKKITIFSSILFAFLVSIDSFSVGIGIKYIVKNIVYASVTFALCSSIFTFLGFIMGRFISKLFEKRIKLISLIILFVLIIYFMCK